jgi:PAS domain S-box-containing protein
MVRIPRQDSTPGTRARNRLAALVGSFPTTEEQYRTLFETLPLGIVYYDADGTVIGTNKAADEILGTELTSTGLWPAIPEGQTFHDDGSPFPWDDMPVPVALRTGEMVADVVIGFTRGESDELHWVRATAVPDARDERGRPTRVYVIITDLTELRRTEAALRQSTALLGQLREANVLGVIVQDERRVYDANDAYLDIIGYSREDLDAGRIDWRKITPPEWGPAQDDAITTLRETGAYPPFEKEYIRKDGRRVPILIGAAVIGHNPLRWTSFVIDLSARQRAERERAALAAKARADRSAAESAREQLDLLMRASALVAATRDRDELLDQVARLAVPSFADFCVVYLPTTDGQLLAGAVSHRHPARARLLSALLGQPMAASGPMLTQRAYETGTTQLSSSLSKELAGWMNAEPEAAGVVNVMRPRSGIATPLPGPDGSLGVLSLSRSAGRAQFTEADVPVVEELGRRLAAGLVNTDAFAREHAIAETLQRSLLPEDLPQVSGLDLAVRYLPATVGAAVGGDWYDAFPLNGGRVGLVIGDVAGHSIASASVMGQVRTLLRGYAIDESNPARVLARVNAALARLLPDVLASAVYAVLDPATSYLSYANSGHPPPLVADAAGQAGYLDDASDVMLGARAGGSFSTGRRRLRPGELLLLYTDGLIEDRHRDITEGLALLAETLRGRRPHTAEEACDTALEMLPGAARRHDDVCLLAARLDLV